MLGGSQLTRSGHSHDLTQVDAVAIHHLRMRGPRWSPESSLPRCPNGWPDLERVHIALVGARVCRSWYRRAGDCERDPDRRNVVHAFEWVFRLLFGLGGRRGIPGRNLSLDSLVWPYVGGEWGNGSPVSEIPVARLPPLAVPEHGPATDVGRAPARSCLA